MPQTFYLFYSFYNEKTEWLQQFILDNSLKKKKKLWVGRSLGNTMFSSYIYSKFETLVSHSILYYGILGFQISS